jgi:hypothetical protein
MPSRSMDVRKGGDEQHARLTAELLFCGIRKSAIKDGMRRLIMREEFRKDCHGISSAFTPRIERCPK